MIDLTEYIVENQIFYDFEAENKQELIKSLVKKIGEIEGLKSTATLLKKINEREKLESTGIGRGFAIPHCHLRNFNDVKVFTAVLSEPIDFDSIDDSKVRIVFVIISGDKNNEAYLKCLSSIIYLIKQNEIREKLLNASDTEEIIKVISNVKEEAQYQLSEQIKLLIELERIDYELSTLEQEKALGSSSFTSDDEIKDTLLQKRKDLETNIDRRIHGIYKNLKKRYDSSIIVKLKGNVCGGCHIKVPVHIVREIKRGMQIVQCESCARVLYSPSIIKPEK